MASFRNVISSRSKNGDIVYAPSGTATGVTVTFAARAFKHLRFRLWANIPGFNPANITLTGMNASTYDITHTLQTAGTAISASFVAAQAAWGLSPGDVGPFTWTGTIWLPAAPALKTHEGRMWTNGALWKREDKCSDNAHDPTAVVFSWTSNVAYTLDVYGYA